MNARLTATAGFRSALAAFLILATTTLPSRADDPPAAPEGRYAKLLAKAPEGRLGTIIEVIGKRGDAADLAYLLARAIRPAASGGFPDLARRQALDALAEGAARGARPTGDPSAIAALLAHDAGVDAPGRAGAARLAGLWRVGPAVPTLANLAEAPATDPSVRDAALEALARINDEPSRAALARLAGPSASPDLRRRAVGALARVDLPLAVNRVAEMAASPAGSDLGPILAPILDQQGGADRLAAALSGRELTPEAARAVLAAVQGLGRSDEALVGPLAKRAGVEAGTLGLTPADLARYNVEVARDGNPARGEAIFRRAELNCQKCHALNGAAGGVGPELTSLGLSSPVDYIARSILEPDESIKEEYQTRIVSLDDGRVIQGIVVAEDDQRLVLKDANGDRREVPVASVEETRRGGSLMPKGLVNGLSRAEFIDLCRFLSELGRPGAYAIRSVPTIQRWRALRPTPPDLAGAGTISTTADPVAPGAEWVPLYAWTDGHLPALEAKAAAGGSVALIEGELAVTTPGTVQLRVEPALDPSRALFLDGRPVPLAPDGTALVSLNAGTRRLTVRLDGITASPDRSIRVEVARPTEADHSPGPPAEFTVVGGK